MDTTLPQGGPSALVLGPYCLSRRTIAVAAFTLIELLTVIAIIGILAAIIIPTVGKVRATAKKSVCLSNLRQVGMAFNLYMHDQRLPTYPPTGAAGDRWVQRVTPYLNAPNLSANAVFNQAIVRCGATNPQYYGDGSSSFGVFGYNRNIAAKRRESIQQPTRTIVLADKNSDYDKNTAGGPLLMSASGPVVEFPVDAAGPAANHGTSANYLYADGHVNGVSQFPGADAFLIP
jgi:prepilin-type N-terminal cleavage/methylation domain-containing protein/prepilin-type processing-associated H-X9-DG protein